MQRGALVQVSGVAVEGDRRVGVEVGQLTADLGDALAGVAVDQRPAAATRLRP
jgi:hypothetical protein